MDRSDTDRWRRIRLPNGRSIEVLALEEADGARLHRCGRCASPYVHPVEWCEAGAAHWEVTLRCPECESVATGVYAQDAVERFDAELDRGTAVVARELRRMVHDNMRDEIERFTRALHDGFVLPEDF